MRKTIYTEKNFAENVSLFHDRSSHHLLLFSLFSVPFNLLQESCKKIVFFLTLVDTQKHVVRLYAWKEKDMGKEKRPREAQEEKDLTKRYKAASVLSFHVYQNEHSGVDYLGITKISLVCLFLRSYMFALFLLWSLLTLKQHVDNEAEEASILMEPTSSHLLLFGSSLK